jgi:DNA uptake protein ComE-like DNA-binding protein
VTLEDASAALPDERDARVRAAAEAAAREAEQRAIKGILTLEDDLARAKEESARAKGSPTAVESARAVDAIRKELRKAEAGARRARTGAAEKTPLSPAPPTAQPSPAGERVDLNSASFEQLRGLKMSVTQARRVIAYRDQRDGFDSVDDLDEVPGFPRAFLAEVKEKLTLGGTAARTTVAAAKARGRPGTLRRLLRL